MRTIPLVDLKEQLAGLSEEIRAGFDAALTEASFILGPQVRAFEESYARFCGVKHCIGVANGTDALEIGLRALDIGAGDEVILPANTFVATALAVVRAGAKPVLVDSDPDYHLIDVARMREKITARTRAIMPVHLYGQCAPMEAISDAIGSRDIAIVEDAAQSQGATRSGRPAGGFGIAAGTSFYPGKNLGALGDAGAVLTDSDAVGQRVRALRNYGSEVKYHHPEVGFNSRLDTLQAVVLSIKLTKLAAWNAARRDAARRYDDLLRAVPSLVLPKVAKGNEHVWHLYVVRVPGRDDVLRKLHADGIGAAIHYPVPLHLQGAFASLGHRAGDFPVAESAASEILSLPMYPEIKPEQQERVADALRRALR